ncbi:uncharacterized protein LOC117297844 isoform X2 [Asterias rubens]|uniref:uncharacterized protein LOC117297844 isoform X2 n=1 Tax=Asterias rubens TaxID=7604 RepID=UPI00145574B4|nr:uncharacterized protein LOC117297844 isoform X2 [Asterias rubens]
METENRIADILLQMGLEDILHKFEEQKVTSSMVPAMSDDELKSLGVIKIGDRYELRKHCQAVGTSSPSKDILGLISQIGKRKSKKGLRSTTTSTCTTLQVAAEENG